MAIKFLSDVETTSSATLSIGELPNPNAAATKFVVHLDLQIELDLELHKKC